MQTFFAILIVLAAVSVVLLQIWNASQGKGGCGGGGCGCLDESKLGHAREIVPLNITRTSTKDSQSAESPN